MTDTMAPSAAPARRRLQLSLSTTALWIAVVGLAIALVLTNRTLRNTQRELAALRPLSVEDVARQFEARTSVSPMKVNVSDVRYSPEKDAYRVAFSWTDSNTTKEWSSDVMLESDGFGVYLGVIRNSEFAGPLGHTNGFTVAVTTPSTLAK